MGDILHNMKAIKIHYSYYFYSVFSPDILASILNLSKFKKISFTCYNIYQFLSAVSILSQ